MRVLILGGTGLISTGITRALVGRGDEVVLLHRGDPTGGADDRAGAPKSIYGDRNVEADLRRALLEGPYDAVIDMICFTRAQADLAVTVFGGRVPQWVFCSTVDVYRKDVDSYPLTESAPREPRRSFPYAFQKAACERELEAAAQRGAFALTIIRPAATYVNGAVAPVGSYQLYVERLRLGEPIVLHGDGSSIWTVAHRDDVALAFVNALGNSIALGRAYHVTGSELLTWNSYWRILAAAIGVDAPAIAHVPTDVLERIAPDGAEWCVENFQYNNIFDNSAASDDLGFAPTISWSEGVKRFDFAFATPVPDDVRDGFESMLATWERGVSVLAR